MPVSLSSGMELTANSSPSALTMDPALVKYYSTLESPLAFLYRCLQLESGNPLKLVITCQAVADTGSLDMTSNRWKYFRWTPRTAWLTFVYAVAVPSAIGYVGFVTDVRYLML